MSLKRHEMAEQESRRKERVEQGKRLNDHDAVRS